MTPKPQFQTPSDHPNNRDLSDAVRKLSAHEMEALALKTLELAKRGHAGAFAFVLQSLTKPKTEGCFSLRDMLGSITRLDEIADAQRQVIVAAASGEITPTEAIHYMKMLNELGHAIKNSDLQHEIDDIWSYIHEDDIN